ncbi:hypothetical protein [Coleofasciculus sp.]|uniref:hypothetical protein n=1 Tax=Coleofasciculus sp. TaxID=3100458 RepID=UPI0039F7EBF9
MADGDNTYEVAAMRQLLQRLLGEQLDRVIGMRRTEARESAAYCRGHRGGNANRQTPNLIVNQKLMLSNIT